MDESLRDNYYMYGSVIDNQTSCRDSPYELILQLLVVGEQICSKGL